MKERLAMSADTRVVALPVAQVKICTSSSYGVADCSEVESEV